MSVNTSTPQPEPIYNEQVAQSKDDFLKRLSRLGRAFWQYTEETGETSTKSFEGLL